MGFESMPQVNKESRENIEHDLKVAKSTQENLAEEAQKIHTELEQEKATSEPSVEKLKGLDEKYSSVLRHHQEVKNQVEELEKKLQ